jgi:hypothetical protein
MRLFYHVVKNAREDAGFEQEWSGVKNKLKATSMKSPRGVRACHTRGCGCPVFEFWIPAFAGMTLTVIHPHPDQHPDRLARLVDETSEVLPAVLPRLSIDQSDHLVVPAGQGKPPRSSRAPLFVDRRVNLSAPCTKNERGSWRGFLHPHADQQPDRSALRT